MEEEFEKEFVKQQIEDIYGSIVNFARDMGVSNQAIHNKLSKPSEKFIRQLASRGIMANKSQVGNNNNYHETNDRLVKVLERLVKSQEINITSLTSTIAHKRAAIKEKDQLITELRKEILVLTKQLHKRE